MAGPRTVFAPKLLTTLKTYDGRQFGADLGAGVVVVIIYGIVQKYGVEGLTLATILPARS